MSNPKMLADALLRHIKTQSPDALLVSVSPRQAAQIHKDGRGGRKDPVSGVLMFDDGFGNTDEGTGTEPGGDAFTDGTIDGYESTGAIDPNTTDPNVETQTDMEGRSNSLGGRAGAQTEQEETTSQQGGKGGAGVSAEEAARANAEYESLYGLTNDDGDPYTQAGEINDAYGRYSDDFNSAGLSGQILGTILDALIGGMRGSRSGPAGMFAGSVYGGLSGRTGDQLGQAGRDSVAEALANGSWGAGPMGAGDDAGGGDGEVAVAGDGLPQSASGPQGGSAPSRGPEAQAPMISYNSELGDLLQSLQTAPGPRDSYNPRPEASVGELRSGLLKRLLEQAMVNRNGQ